MKILISWYAYSRDFNWSNEGTTARKKKEISPNSPTWNVHKYYWENYDKHILLNGNSMEEDIRYYDFLYSELTKEFKTHLIEKAEIPITDVIDVNEISIKIQKLLSKYSDCEIDLFVSPGTPQMQVSWYLASINFKNKLNLFQLRDAKHTKDKLKPEKLVIKLDDSILPTNLNIATSIQEDPKVPSKHLISESIKSVYTKALAVANTYDVTCLILGENGTGKENLASFIHNNSTRSKGLFKAVNCAAYSDELLASELFGHKKGSFTGAYSDKKGLLEDADGGTVFLDEIGDISPKMQVSLLRVIQEKEIQPIGSNEIKKIDVRIIAATNKDLIKLSRDNEFRWDLFFRLSVAELKLPPLRERGKNEIKDLLNHFIKSIAPKFKGRKNKLKIKLDAEKLILGYNFPGNIRELENLVISLYTFCESDVAIGDLPEKINNPFANESFKLEDAEKKHILWVYKVFKENILQAAEALNISKNTLKDRLDKYGVR
jgi:transcriptional regulator with PAS, ATPase and Fis domain